MGEKIVAVVAKDRTPRTQHDLLQKKLVEHLSARGNVVVFLSPHLYDLAMDGSGVELLRSVPGDMMVFAWLYPRATYWLLDAHKIGGRLGLTSSVHEDDAQDSVPHRHGELRDRTIWCFDLRSYQKPETLLSEVDEILGAATRRSEGRAEANGKAVQVEESTKSRWYPVIDYQRCNNCMECLNFCLFGVFSLDEENRILVEQPDACRAGCPACSRVCPEGAIMFPQHKDPGIAGDPTASRGGLKLDLSQLFAGQNPLELAAAERDRALREKQVEEANTSQKDELDHLVDELDDLDL
jgi:NAD-dependent dihydropyrimidine dehydrogenase PreA subunit